MMAPEITINLRFGQLPRDNVMAIRVILQEIGKLCRSTRSLRSGGGGGRGRVKRPRVPRTSMRNALARLFDNHLPIRRVRVRPTISVTMANKGKVARDGCARYYKSRATAVGKRGENSARQGRGAAIIRRPLGPTTRPPPSPPPPSGGGPRCRRFAIVSQFYCIADRGITWRGQTSRSVSSPPPAISRARTTFGSCGLCGKGISPRIGRRGGRGGGGDE